MGVHELRPGMLRALREKVQALASASGGLMNEAGQLLGATSLKLLADEFKESRGPYGESWPAPVLRTGKPLTDTGRMRNSVTVAPAANGFRLRIATSYANVHQYGATIVPKRAKALMFRAGGRFYRLAKAVIPQRQMLPMQSTGGIGPIWGRAFAETLTRLIKQRMLGKAA